MLFAGLGSVRIVKNCDLGLENVARGAASGNIFKTYPANNKYMYFLGEKVNWKKS